MSKTSFFHSLSYKIAVKFSLVLSLCMIFITVIFSLAADNNITQRQHKEINDAVTLLSSIVIEKGADKGNFKNVHLQIPPYLTVNVFETASEKVLFTNEPALMSLPPSETVTTLDVPSTEDSSQMYIMYRSTEVKSSDGKEITVQVAMKAEKSHHDRLLNVLPFTVAEALIPSFLSMFLITYAIARQTLKPVSEITKSAQKISTTTLDNLLPESGNKDELDVLAQTFNSLFKRIKADFDRERQFTSNVSHELKTPVAVILGQANLLRRWGKDDREQLEKSITSIIKESKSMEAIITNLLQISRIENGKIVPFIEEVKVSDIFRRIKDECSSWSKDTTVTFDEGIDLIIKTDRELVHQVITAVVNNSIKFSPVLCVITLEAVIKENKLDIIITDNGQGFDEKDLAFVFDRFYRGDESHNRNKGGSGLGLSISKVIMQSLNGDISASNKKDDQGNKKGAMVTLEFPL